MTRHLVLGLVLIVGSSAGVRAQDRTQAAVVYDVNLREFVCWREGALVAAARAQPCNPSYGWHPVSSELYFTRGEAISVLLVNAVALNLFALDVKADDLPEPTTPIQGALSELPKLVPLVTPPTIVSGVGAAAALAGATPPVKPSQTYRLLTAATEKDFTAWLKTGLIAPLTAKEVTDFLALDTSTAIDQLKATPAWIATVQATLADLDAISPPTTTSELVAASRTLIKLLNDQQSVRSRLTAIGIPAAGKIISDAVRLLRTAPLADALAIDSGDFLTFTSEVEIAFPQGARYSRAAALAVDKGKLIIDPKYADAGNPAVEMAGFLARVQADAGGTVSADQLKRLKANLVILSDNWSDVIAAQKRLDVLVTTAKAVETHRTAATSVFALQKVLNDVADATIRQANALNAAGNALPLEYGLQVLPVGQWFGSKTITLTIKQGQRVGLFDLPGVSEAARTPVAAAPDGQASSKALQAAAADLASVRTMQFPVYNLYRFQLGLGMAFSTADDARFQVTTVTAGSGSSATTDKYIDQTISREHNLLWTANLIVFTEARHAFPWRPRFADEAGPKWWSNVGATIGFSMTEPNRNFLFGGVWFPQRNTVGVQVAYHLALRDIPAADLKAPVTGRTTIFDRRRFDGVGVGLLVTPDFFSKVFAPIFKP